MKKRDNLPAEIKERVKEVKMDNMSKKEKPQGVSGKDITAETDKINPDSATLDRG